MPQDTLPVSGREASAPWGRVGYSSVIFLRCLDLKRSRGVGRAVTSLSQTFMFCSEEAYGSPSSYSSSAHTSCDLEGGSLLGPMQE